MEKRHYSKNWSEIIGKKPLEYRPLTIPTSKAPQGSISCWLEIYDAKKPPEVVDITPPPQEEFEVRVIVWGAKTQNIFMDPAEKCNDLYVKCNLG